MWFKNNFLATYFLKNFCLNAPASKLPWGETIKTDLDRRI